MENENQTNNPNPNETENVTEEELAGAGQEAPEGEGEGQGDEGATQQPQMVPKAEYDKLVAQLADKGRSERGQMRKVTELTQRLDQQSAMMDSFMQMSNLQAQRQNLVINERMGAVSPETAKAQLADIDRQIGTLQQQQQALKFYSTTGNQILRAFEDAGIAEDDPEAAVILKRFNDARSGYQDPQPVVADAISLAVKKAKSAVVDEAAIEARILKKLQGQGANSGQRTPSNVAALRASGGVNKGGPQPNALTTKAKIVEAMANGSINSTQYEQALRKIGETP